MADLTRRNFLLSVGGAATAMAASGAVPAQETREEWPMFGYDVANTNSNPDGAGPTAAAGPLWNVETGGQVRTSAAVVGETVYVGGGGRSVYALDAETGAQQWEFQTDGQVNSSPAVVDVSTAEDTDGGASETVYVGSDDGYLYAIDAAEGDLEWRFETGGPVESSPTVFDGTVYVGSRDGFLYAIDAVEGDEQWSIDTLATIRWAPAVAPAGAADGSAIVYVGNDDGTLHAIDADSGNRHWVVAVDGPVRGAPVVVEDTVYVGSLDASDSFTGHVYAFDATVDGETADENGDGSAEDDIEADNVLRWRSETDGAIVATPAVTDEAVFVGTRTGLVSSFDADDGEERWQVESGLQTQVLAPPTVAGDLVYVSSESEGVLAFEADDGEERWRVESEGSVQSQPVAALGRLYVGSGNAIYALEEGLDGELGAGTHGMGGGDEATGGGPEPDDSQPLGVFTFLLWPVSLVALVALFGSIVYAAKRAGVLDRIEEVADAYGGDVDAERSAEADSAAATAGASGGPETEESGSGGATPVWDLVLDDVIARAEETDRTATDDLLVTKYVDSGTLDSPVVAFEVESFREGPARVRLTEPLLVEDGDESRPLGDNWTVEDDELVFEAVVEPDETTRTLVGRPDCPDDRVGDLVTGPAVTVEDV